MNELVKIENNELIIPEEITNKIKNFYEAKKEMEYQESLLKEALLEVMPNYPEPTAKVGGLKITYRKETIATTCDTTRLKKERPVIFEEFSKQSSRKASVSISLAEE